MFPALLFGIGSKKKREALASRSIFLTQVCLCRLLTLFPYK